MHELLDGAASDWLEFADFKTDFERQFWTIGEVGFWKIERQQHFREPGYDTWEAFARGDWEESLRLLEAGRADLDAQHRRIEESGFTVNRVRVVEEPIIPYLQWELHVLRVREQCGSRIRIVGPEQVASLEPNEPLPEIFTLDKDVMYQAVYNDHGILEGAREFTDPDLILRCQRVIADLFAVGSRWPTISAARWRRCRRRRLSRLRRSPLRPGRPGWVRCQKWPQTRVHDRPTRSGGIGRFGWGGLHDPDRSSPHSTRRPSAGSRLVRGRSGLGHCITRNVTTSVKSAPSIWYA